MLKFGQSPQRIEIPLTFKEFRTVSEMIALSLGGIVGLLSEQTPKGYSPLPGTVKPQFFELSHEAGTLIGLAALSSPEAETYDRIWVDWNRDKKFTKRGVASDKTAELPFGPPFKLAVERTFTLKPASKRSR